MDLLDNLILRRRKSTPKNRGCVTERFHFSAVNFYCQYSYNMYSRNVTYSCPKKGNGRRVFFFVFNFFNKKKTFFHTQAVFIFIMINMTPTEFNDYRFPQWADLIGWMVGVSTLLPFVVAIAYHLLKEKVNVILFRFVFIFQYCKSSKINHLWITESIQRLN